MINFDFGILSRFLLENNNFLTGARIQKIQQPTRQDFVFSVRNFGESRKLYVNIHPNFFHLCFMSKENEEKRFIEIPKSPPMFCMLLRKYLEGAKITKVVQPQGERILEFYFETYNELSEKIFLCLAIELMGKHSNVVLYNYDTNVIIGCAHNVGDDKSRERHLIGNLPYVYPAKSLNKKYFGLSAHFENELEKGESANELIDNYFADLQYGEKIKSLRQKLLSLVSAKLKKVNNTFQKMEKQSTTKEKADLYRKYGDLIMANLFSEKDFSRQIEILDWETNTPLKIELDETKTLKENANKYYKLYNKAKTTLEKSQEMIENLQIEKDYLEQVLYSIESATDMGDLIEIEEEIANGKREAVNGKQKSEKTRSPSPVQCSPVKMGNFDVYVGKNNKQNDYIISKIARDEDLWFHVRLGGGAHVLLKAENGAKPDEKIIFECAKLAKENSRAKNSSKVGVIYTKAKYLRKPPCAKLGYVTYKNEKEILVD